MIHFPMYLFIYMMPMLFALFLVLLVLKLLRKIDLSWFWVSAPAWLPWFSITVLPFLYALITGKSLYY